MDSGETAEDTSDRMVVPPVCRGGGATAAATACLPTPARQSSPLPVTPLDSAVRSARAAMASFHPRSMPRMARKHYAREMTACGFQSILFGAVDGMIAGIVAKNAFGDVVPAHRLDLVVTLLTAVGAFANVTSFFWAAVGHGRNKIRLLVTLQALAIIAVAQVALAPRTAFGLGMLVVGVLIAGTAWSGIVTTRAAIWRANFPVEARARLTGKIATVQSMVVAGTGLGIGAAMKADAGNFPYVFGGAAFFGLIAALLYRRMRMRGAPRLARLERDSGRSLAIASPLTAWRILRDDRPYRGFMGAMFLFGTGNVVTNAPLVILLKDQFGYAYLKGILVTTVIPVLLIPIVVPIWSRLLDRVHVITFRAIHAWAFTAASLLMFFAALWHLHALMWVSSIFKGAAFAGGALAWNIGHLDFAPEAKSTQYMGVHVTLEGLRGLVGPALGLGLYKLFEAWHAGAGGWVFGVAFALNALGALWFAAQSARLGEMRRRRIARA